MRISDWSSDVCSSDLQRKEQVVRLRNKWVPVDPQEWRTRPDMTVNIGLGIGTREQNLLHLNAIWEKQKEIALSGGMGTLVRSEERRVGKERVSTSRSRRSPQL